MNSPSFHAPSPALCKLHLICHCVQIKILEQGALPRSACLYCQEMGKMEGCIFVGPCKIL